MEDFVKIERGRRRKNNKKSKPTSLLKRLCDTKSDLVITPFYQELLEKLRCVVTKVSPECDQDCPKKKSIDFVCYGLGSFIDSYIARYQLALLMALRADIQTDTDTSLVYDPIFNQEEREFLAQQRFIVPDDNSEGKFTCSEDRLTVFYMPHCGKALYNNVLWRNWGEDSLCEVVLIGNSFSRMIDSTPSRILQKTAGYVIKIHPYTRETNLDCPEDLDCIFNDTSIHVFNTQEVPQELWEEREEPVYENDDAEIIFSSKDY